MRVLQALSIAAAGVALANAAPPLCQRVASNVQAPPPLSADQKAELAWFPPQLNWCEQGYCLPTRADAVPCGACYLHAAVASAQDRILIQRKTPVLDAASEAEVRLNRQSFLNCAPAMGLSAGCAGGSAHDVFEFMSLYGLPHQDCLPYTGTDHNQLKETFGSCPPQAYCTNAAKNPVRYRATEAGRLSGEYDIIKELIRGPVTCGVASTEALEKGYKRGVFEDTTGAKELTQDVEIVGWGEEQGLKFWHVRTSFGPEWGDKGFFKLVRGKNNLGIESDCHFVVPKEVEDELVFMKKNVEEGKLLWSMLAVGQTPPDVMVVVSKPFTEVEPEREAPLDSVVEPVVPATETGTKEKPTSSMTVDRSITTHAVVVSLVVLGVVVAAVVGVRAYRQRQYAGYTPLL